MNQTTVGIFTSAGDASRAVDELEAAGFAHREVSVLTPGGGNAVPTSDTEQPGMGRAVGGVVGGALGLAGAAVFVPGVGPVLAAGLIAAALTGAGTAAGVAVGGQLENALFTGLPADELFFYEDALRCGRSVVIVFAEDEARAGQARAIFQRVGAESLDAARERWWLGLRDAEGPACDDPIFRHGFEAALEPGMRGKQYHEAPGVLGERYRDASHPSFRRGYERGQEHYRGLPGR